MARLKAQAASWDPTPVHYSPHQRTQSDVQFAGGAVTELIAHPPVIEFLRAALGPDLVFMHAHYAISAPGHPGMNLHTDSHPYGTSDWGYAFSAPRQVRVLYYLDDLTPDVAPLRVIPRSHLSMHPDANPYKRYPSHPDEVVVTAPAGTAVVINLALFHANGPNTGSRAREMIALVLPPRLVRPNRAGPGPLAGRRAGKPAARGPRALRQPQPARHPRPARHAPHRPPNQRPRHQPPPLGMPLNPNRPPASCRLIGRMHHSQRRQGLAPGNRRRLAQAGPQRPLDPRGVVAK